MSVTANVRVKRKDTMTTMTATATSKAMRGKTISDTITNHELLAEVLKTLTYRECEIIKLRHGLGDGYIYTREEVGKIFKTTQGRIRSVEAKAIQKLRHPTRADKLRRALTDSHPLIVKWIGPDTANKAIPETKTAGGTTNLEALIELQDWLRDLLRRNEQYAQQVRKGRMSKQTILTAERKAQEKTRWIAALGEAIERV